MGRGKGVVGWSPDAPESCLGYHLLPRAKEAWAKRSKVLVSKVLMLRVLLTSKWPRPHVPGWS